MLQYLTKFLFRPDFKIFFFFCSKLEISGYQKRKRTQVIRICTIPLFLIQGNIKRNLEESSCFFQSCKFSTRVIWNPQFTYFTDDIMASQRGLPTTHSGSMVKLSGCFKSRKYFQTFLLPPWQRLYGLMIIQL